MCRPNGISRKVLLFKLVMLRKCNQKKMFLDAIKENKLAISEIFTPFSKLTDKNRNKDLKCELCQTVQIDLTRPYELS